MKISRTVMKVVMVENLMKISTQIIIVLALLDIKLNVTNVKNLDTVRNCRSNFIFPSKETRQVPIHHMGKQLRTWKKKHEDLKVDECGLALQAQSRISQWYIDGGCSKHMTGDKDKFC